MLLLKTSVLTRGLKSFFALLNRITVNFGLARIVLAELFDSKIVLPRSENFLISALVP
jgi:ribosomal protein S25